MKLFILIISLFLNFLPGMLSSEDLVRKVTSMAGPIKKRCSQGCDVALDYAIISHPEMISPAEKARLGVITKRLFDE